MGTFRAEQPVDWPAVKDGCPLAIRLFGPIEVRVHGKMAPPLRVRKDGWLLALLVLRHDREVDRSWLSRTLWPESVPDDAAYNLRRSLRFMRRSLGEAAHHLHTSTAHTLCLETSGAEVDLLDFDAAIARGDVGSLKTATALYKGPLLEGCTEDWILPEREAREWDYVNALEALATHALIHGDPEAAVAYLRRAVAVDPLRESAQRRLMEALTAAGEYAAVKRVYRDLREMLHQNVNAEPDPATSALWERIQELQRRRGGGRRGPVLQGSLPRPVSSLVGRKVELREIGARLVNARLLTLTGPAGVGKTRLAIRAAEERIPCCADGVYFVELAPLKDGALLPNVVAAALQIRVRDSRPGIETILDEFESRSALLVLDNCEHLVDDCARLADALLRGCRHVRILATSREPLGVAGEMVLRVPPLASPALTRELCEGNVVEDLEEYEAVRLFIERASGARPGWEANRSNIESVVQICQRLEGSPLAIELAAARVRVLSVAQIVGKLDEPFYLLTGGSRTVLPRQQTLRAALDWSYDLLSMPERVVLRRLSVFEGGWTLEAAEAIVADAQIQPRELLDLLMRLADKSLVTILEQNGAARYRLLEVMRQYGWDRLVEADEAGSESVDSVRRRHREYFLQMAEEEARQAQGNEQMGWLNRISSELYNLRSVLGWSLENDPELGLRLVIALSPLWLSRDRLSEARVWLDRLLERASSVSAQICAAAYGHAGLWTQMQGDHAAASVFYQQALTIGRAAGDTCNVAWALYHLSLMAIERGEHRQALAMLEEISQLDTMAENVLLSILARIRRGVVYGYLGDATRARLLFEESLLAAREAGDSRAILRALDHLGDAAADRGDYASARAFHEEKLALARSTGDHIEIPHALNDLARVSWRTGDCHTAHIRQEEALIEARRLGGAAVQTLCLNRMVQMAASEGDLKRMDMLSRESLVLASEGQLMVETVDALRQLAAVAVGLGSAARAARLLGAADRIQERMRSSHSPGAQELLSRTVTATRAALSDEAYYAAQAEGRTLTPEQAIAFALEEC